MKDQWEELLGNQLKEIAKNENVQLSYKRKMEIYNEIVQEGGVERNDYKPSLFDRIISKPFKYAFIAAGLQTIGSYILFQNMYVDFITKMIGGI